VDIEVIIQIIVALGGIAGLLAGGIVVYRHQIRQSQKVDRGSVGIQAGGDINIDRKANPNSKE